MIPVLPHVRRVLLSAKSASHPALSTPSTWPAASRLVLIALIFAVCASHSWREIRHFALPFANCALRLAKRVPTPVKSTAPTMLAAKPALSPAAPALLLATVAAK